MLTPYQLSNIRFAQRATVVFFLALNTEYYWSLWVGYFGMFLIFIGFGVFVMLLVGWIIHLVKSIQEKFRFKKRNILLLSLSFVITATIWKPFGLIDFDRLEGKDKLSASHTSTIDCLTELKLKENGKFIHHSYCFGRDRISGQYVIKDSIVLFASSSEYYDFGIIPKNNSKIIRLYQIKRDKMPLTLFIKENKLQ